MAHRSPIWPAGISIVVHLAVLVGALWLLVPFAVTAPQTMPQIELLPPLPVPTTPAEAKPSPVQMAEQSTPAPAPVAAEVPEEIPLPQETKVDTPVTDTNPKPEARPVPIPPQPEELPKIVPVQPVLQPETPPVIHTDAPQAEMELPEPPPPKPKVLVKHRPPARRRLVANREAIPTKTPPAAAQVNGSETKKQTVVADAAAPAAPAGPPPDYIGLIRARLEKVKRYPDEARSRAEQGTPYIRFVLDRSGRLLSSRLERASGISSLDAEAEAMVEKAAPFPPFPTSMQRTRLELIVPIQFTLR